MTVVVGAMARALRLVLVVAAASALRVPTSGVVQPPRSASVGARRPIARAALGAAPAVVLVRRPRCGGRRRGRARRDRRRDRGLAVRRVAAAVARDALLARPPEGERAAGRDVRPAVPAALRLRLGPAALGAPALLRVARRRRLAAAPPSLLTITNSSSCSASATRSSKPTRRRVRRDRPPPPVARLAGDRVVRTRPAHARERTLPRRARGLLRRRGRRPADRTAQSARAVPLWVPRPQHRRVVAEAARERAVAADVGDPHELARRVARRDGPRVAARGRDGRRALEGRHVGHAAAAHERHHRVHVPPALQREGARVVRHRAGRVHARRQLHARLRGLPARGSADGRGRRAATSARSFDCGLRRGRRPRPAAAAAPTASATRSSSTRRPPGGTAARVTGRDRARPRRGRAARAPSRRRRRARRPRQSARAFARDRAGRRQPTPAPAATADRLRGFSRSRAAGRPVRSADSPRRAHPAPRAPAGGGATSRHSTPRIRFGGQRARTGPTHSRSTTSTCRSSRAWRRR